MNKPVKIKLIWIIFLLIYRYSLISGGRFLFALKENEKWKDVLSMTSKSDSDSVIFVLWPLNGYPERVGDCRNIPQLSTSDL